MQDQQKLSVIALLRRRIGTAAMLVVVSRVLLVEYVLVGLGMVLHNL